MSCLFCQREFTEAPSRYERTREHVFGNWTTPYLKSDLGPGTQVRWNATRDETTRSAYPAYPAQQAVQGVCGDCNSGWLSEIQTAAKPPLIAALRNPKRRSFGEAEQMAMATWALRAALIAGAKADQATVPASHLHDFYEVRKPPDKTRIWLAATGRRQFTYIYHQTIKVSLEDDEPPPRANAFMSVLAVGHVAFCVLCWTDVKPVSLMGRIQGTYGDAVIPIFPVRRPISWPPRQTFTYEGLDQLAGVGGTWED